MGRTMTIFALHSWSTMTVGYGKILSFVFLGKGFYYARYADLDTMYALVNMVENLSLMLILSLMHRLRLCVIVRFHMLKDLPVFSLPHVSLLANVLGRILHILKYTFLITSTNIHVCILWDM